MYLIKPLILFTSLFIAVQAHGQERLSLSDAIQKALENNYNIRVINQREEIAGIRDSWGEAGRFPTLNLDLSSNNRSDFNEDTDFTNNTLNPGVDLNWVLFDGFSIRIMKQKLVALSRLSRGNTTVLVENTIQAVIITYYSALLEKEKLRVFKEVMNLSQDRYDYVETRKELGSAVTFDVLQEKNSWLEDKSLYLFQEVNYNNAIRDLIYLMGITEDVSFDLTGKFTELRKNYRYEDLQLKMLNNNKTLKNQYINLELLKKDLKLAQSLYYPSVRLRSGVDGYITRMKYSNTDPRTSNSLNYYANLSLTFSLFDTGSRKRALEIAKIQQDIGFTETDEMIHSLTNELKKLLETYRVRHELLNVAEERVEAAVLNQQISEDKFKAGSINSFNYRDVQLIYLNSSIDRIQAEYNLVDADAALMRITGGIIAEY